MQNFMPNIGNPLTEKIKKKLRKELEDSAEQSEGVEKMVKQFSASLLDDDKSWQKMYGK